MKREDFDKARATFRKGIETSKSLAEKLSVAALAHFAEHGDTSYIQDFYSDLRGVGKNYLRSAAFLKWLVAYAPVKMEAHKFVKDQERAITLNWANEEAKAALLAKAAETTFWDHDPELAVVNYKADDVIEAVEKLVKRFESGKNMKAADADASAVVVSLKEFASKLKTPTNSNVTPGEEAAA